MRKKRFKRSFFTPKPTLQPELRRAAPECASRLALLPLPPSLITLLALEEVGRRDRTTGGTVKGVIGGGGIKLPVSFCFLGRELGEARHNEPGNHASMAFFDDWRIWGSLHCFA